MVDGGEAGLAMISPEFFWRKTLARALYRKAAQLCARAAVRMIRHLLAIDVLVGLRRGASREQRDQERDQGPAKHNGLHREMEANYVPVWATQVCTSAALLRPALRPTFGVGFSSAAAFLDLRTLHGLGLDHRGA